MKLIISEPCHLNWDSMTPSGDGRYCSSCNKIVIDFSRMNDEELKNYFIHHTAASTCGRLNVEPQCDTTIPERARMIWSWHATASKKNNREISPNGGAFYNRIITRGHRMQAKRDYTHFSRKRTIS